MDYMTLEQALTDEQSIEKDTMLAMLTPVARLIKEDEIKEIMKGTSTNSYKITDLHSIRLFCSYRIKNGFSVFPFPNMTMGDEHFPPSY